MRKLLLLTLMSLPLAAMQCQKTTTSTTTSTSASSQESTAVGLIKMPFRIVWAIGAIGVELGKAGISWATSPSNDRIPPNDNDPKKDHNHSDILKSVRDIVKKEADINIAQVNAYRFAMNHVKQRYPQMNKYAAAARRVYYRRHIRTILRDAKQLRSN